ncbi:MAG: hypothetical protein IT336_04530, partial [Thermomicrobiales bacterium]|nr:hypothetical protein [Thermomicrobiales bacterium]
MTAEPHVQETGSETQGALTLVAKTPWGTALADVCVQAVPSVGGAPAAEGCSGTDGRVTLTGLESGDYTVSAVTVPSGWQEFAPATVTIAPGPAGELVVTLPFVSVGTLTFTGVVMYGPEIVPGGCVRVTTRDGGQPGSHVIAGPVCDEDGDGTALIPDVPNMRLCIVVTPPEGFYRPSRDYAHCLDGFAGNGSFTLGFRKVRPTPTPVVDTPIPFPTSTPTPTRTPAPDEGNISLTVRNCVAVFSGDTDPTDYNGCRAAPAGVRLRVMQRATEVGTFTTNANGAIAFDLPALTAYRLEYLDGNGADWVPSELEESRLRYGEASTFFFVPAPEVDDSWTMVVRIWKDINNPIPGGCAKIVDFQHPEITLLPELCDTDGDGEIVLGELPARPQTANYTRPTAYGAVITSLPVESGYAPLSSPYGGVEPNDLDFRWVSTPTVAFISVALHVTFIDAVTRAPVQGLCLDFDGGGLGSLVCDQGSGLIETSLLRNSNYIAAVTNVPPGYLQPDALHLQTPQYPQGTPDKPNVHLIERTVELARDPNSATGSADVVIFLRQVTARGDSPFAGGSPVAEPVCLTISPVPQGTLATRCTTTRYGTVFFIDLPPGEYTFTADWSPTGTGWICGTDPSPFGLTVGDDDLGTLLARTFTWQCRYPAGEGATCAVIDERVIRDVDIYMGTLRDPETGEVIATTVQFSEAVSERFVVSLLDPEYWDHGDLNPAPDVLTWETVKAWTERGDEAWGIARDWDGDARQRAIDDFERVLGGPVVFEEETEIAVSEIPGGIFSKAIFSPTQEESPYCYGPGKVVVITTLGLARVRFVEVSAIPAPPSPTPTSTPDGTATPTPSATPEEEPVCVSPLVREVTLAYGALRHGTTVVAEGVAVSDLLPPAVVAAILAGDPPDAIADGLEEWADDGLDPFDWAAGTPSGADP